jgi:hypothetical protein
MLAQFDTVLVCGRHGDVMHGNHGMFQSILTQWLHAVTVRRTALLGLS